MKYLLTTLFAGLLIPAVAGAQELPKATKEGKEALQKLVDACVADGGLRAAEGPKGKQLTVTDEDKLKATVAAHPELLTPKLRNALVVGWAEQEEAGQGQDPRRPRRGRAPLHRRLGRGRRGPGFRAVVE